VFVNVSMNFLFQPVCNVLKKDSADVKMFGHFWYQLVQVALKRGFKTIGVTSAKEVVFCLFVCLLAGLRKDCSDSLHRIWWKAGTWATEETIGFDGNLDHVMLGL